jgi:NADH-quinone oxidoreductase subunit J
LLFCINTVYCLFSFIGIILCLTSLLILIRLEFFALIYLLIYIGAILVFFIFTIMLLNLKFTRILEMTITNSYVSFIFVILNVIIQYFLLCDFYKLEDHFINSCLFSRVDLYDDIFLLQQQ